MSATPPPGSGEQPPDDEVLAGELALGVLAGTERQAALQRNAADPAFAARVAGWEQRLAPLLEQVPPAAAPPHLWPAIRRRLGWQEETGRPGLWRSLTLWRAATALALALAAGLWLTRPAPPPASEAGLTKPVTELVASNGTPGWLASVDRARGTVLMVPVPRPADARGRVPELWIIPAGQAPRSLGAVSTSRAHTVAVPDRDRAALAAPGSVLAITLEPATGLPHPAPSGPVLAKGLIHT